jgi:hypothetical protein
MTGVTNARSTATKVMQIVVVVSPKLPRRMRSCGLGCSQVVVRENRHPTSPATNWQPCWRGSGMVAGVACKAPDNPRYWLSLIVIVVVDGPAGTVCLMGPI